ncbi:MAG: hypothetical protein V1837_02225 [Candidatus Woesearchaeota archaeon]
MVDPLKKIEHTIANNVDSVCWLGYCIPNKKEIRQRLSDPCTNHLTLFTYAVMAAKNPVYSVSRLNLLLDAASIGLTPSKVNYAQHDFGNSKQFLSLPTLVFYNTIDDTETLVSRMNQDPFGKTLSFDCISPTDAGRLKEFIDRDIIHIILYPNYPTAYAALAHTASYPENRFKFLSLEDLKHTQPGFMDIPKI